MKNLEKVRLSDYKEYPFEIKDIFLDFNILDEYVEVEASYTISPKNVVKIPLILKGTEIHLEEISLDGDVLSYDKYLFKNNNLEIKCVPDKEFILNIKAKINPYNNLSLEGLYSSSDILTTQCEAEGFRRICFHPDRPDVLSKYTVRIESNINKYPILLSNGNKISDKNIPGKTNRHEVIWQDPFPKPSYLFALVGGDLVEIKSKYKTLTNNEVSVNLFVEKGDEGYTTHAIDSIHKAMRWDEEVYNLEYDLNTYNIVAVRHFNMGAMENKGLNIFNSKLILADSNITTDSELERIESVIAHEYFHNWTGNRITCRDWFQLSLKEGLTVFRDQSFTSDLHSSSIKRIEDVALLRNVQFKEDAGPTSHPVKPSEYIAIDNFYTTTIYEKGAEIIRMLYRLLGKENYMYGIKLYIKKFDGKAATTENFIYSVFKGAKDNGYVPDYEVDSFINWYYQAGTPHVSVKREWDKSNDELKLNIKQELKSIGSKKNKPLIIPIRTSILNSKKYRQPFTLILDKEEKQFIFKNISTDSTNPILSIFRGFSAPVNWTSDLSTDELFYLIENDNDLFSIWDTVQLLTRKAILERCNNSPNGPLELKLIRCLEKSIHKFKSKNHSFIAKLLTIPSVAELECYKNPIEPIKIDKEYFKFKELLANALVDSLKDLLIICNKSSNHIWPKGQGERKLIEVIWSYLILVDTTEIRKDSLEAINGPSMTLSKAAINALIPVDCIEREEALNRFYERWKNNPVVLDSWFSFQSLVNRKDSIGYVKKLLKHPRFDPIAPNSIRAILGGFSKNIHSFHSIDGKGYMFMAEQIIDIDKRNPITASRISKIFSRWNSFIEPNRKMMLKAIKYLLNENISTNTKEVLDLIINDEKI